MAGPSIYKQLTFYSQNIHDSFFIFDDQGEGENFEGRNRKNGRKTEGDEKSFLSPAMRPETRPANLDPNAPQPRVYQANLFNEKDSLLCRKGIVVSTEYKQVDTNHVHHGNSLSS